MNTSTARILILHIGLHKTGSTAVQHFCQLNRKRLAAGGICYPETGLKWSGHHPYAWSLGLKHPHYDEAAGSSSEIAQHMIAEAKDKNILLSSEDFEFLGPMQMQQVKADFPEYEPRIIVYLRPQDSYLESEYAQHVRMDETRFKGDIKDFYMSFDFMQRYNYMQLLRPWDNQFGKDNICVRPFDPEQFFGNDLLHDFCDALGILWDNHFRLPAKEESNISLSAGALRVLRELNNLEIDSSDRAVILEVLHRLGKDEETVLTPTTRRSFNKIFEKTNQRVAQRYLGGRTELFPETPQQNEN